MHGLRPGVSIESHGNRWSFAEVSELSNDLGDFVHGYLVKFRDSFEEIIRPEEGQFDETTISDRVEAKSELFLHIKSGLIAYHPTGSEISINTFQSRFCKVFEEAYENLFISTEIQAIEERFEIFEKIRELQVIEKISFKLHPSNPNNTPIWKDADDDIKSMGASSYVEEYSVEPGVVKGLNRERILEDEQIRGKFVIAEDGYGEGKVTGTRDGERKVISTRSNPTTTTVLVRESAEETLDSLKDTLRKLFDRFKPDER